MMDRISGLHDELLLEILSYLPTKHVVDTMVLSKRWQFLWTKVPQLIYDDSYQSDYGKFSQFVKESLFKHDAPVIETFHFKLSKIQESSTEDIRVWTRAVDKRHVRELIIQIDDTPLTLPSSMFFTWCKMLVYLKLKNLILVDHVTSSISFPSLKTLRLQLIKYPNEEYIKRLLSGCPILEDLLVEQSPDDNVPNLSIRVLSLKRLVLLRSEEAVNYDSHGYVIYAPSLEFVEIRVLSYVSYCVIENNMTKIVKANLVINYWEPWKKIMDSVISAKRLYLCLPTSKDAYPVGGKFSSLVHLLICTCETEWLDLLIRVLRDSPNLRSLRIKQCHDLRPPEPRPHWDETRLLPEYLLSSLETFEWVGYGGTEVEKEVVGFILRIATCLKKATIIASKEITDHNKKLEMLADFPLSSRRSQTCLLAFQWSYVQDQEPK